jgi:ferric-dicitrate binding protein FerR (iron transport regulator)
MNFSLVRIAAAIVLIIGMGALGYLFFNNAAPKQMLAQTQGNVLKDTLSDGSMVTLNKRSSLSYPEQFKGNKRKVALKGEAFFNVAPDKTKPFIISVNDVEVTVVGTSFNVKSENGNTEVIVETGVVKVTKAGKTIELRPGQKTMIAAADSSPVKQEVTDKLYNYYRSREFDCENTPLWKLVEVLNEAYDAHIVIGTPEIRNKPITTTFNNESLEHILDIIKETFYITITRNGDEIILQ